MSAARVASGPARCAGACLAALVVAAAPAFAQESAASRQDAVTVLTLQDALDRAAEHNPSYRQALNRVELAGPQARQAWGAFLPSFDVNYSTGQSFSRRSTAFDNFDNPIEREVTRTITSSSASQGASLNLNVLEGGRRFHALGQARSEAEATRRAGDVQLNSIQAETRRHFLVAQRQKARLALEERLLADRAQDRDLTSRRFELAMIGRSDLLAAELDLERQRTAVNTARTSYDKALFALRANLGDPSLGRIDVDGTAPRIFDPNEEIDLGDLLARALDASPRILQAQAEFSANQAALKTSKARRWPSISVGGSIRRSSYEREGAALFDMSPKDMSGGLTLSVQVPVFSQFQTSYAIAQADVALRNAAESIRENELDVERQIRTQFADLEAAWRAASEQGRTLEIAEQRLVMVREEYELAVKSVEELRTAVREQASALRDAVDRSYAFAAVLVNLHEAAGMFGGTGPAGSAPGVSEG